jgi:prepilin-type N-terminal cleavage/methylation domain-containing protein
VDRAGAFTLIELILVMTILTIAVSVTAPALANFFRGRSLDSEARRLLALIHQGQSRAVSEGLPMELWLDTVQGKFGLVSEPSFEPQDPKAIEFAIDPGMKIEVVADNNLNMNLGAGSLGSGNMNLATTPIQNTAPVRSVHPELPKIRFLPNGTISETSPQRLSLTDRDGRSIWLGQTRNRLSYEIQNPSY